MMKLTRIEAGFYKLQDKNNIFSTVERIGNKWVVDVFGVKVTVNSLKEAEQLLKKNYNF